MTMNLVYTDPQHNSIRATLGDDERLGNVHGPATIFVPTDPANREYAEIVEKGYPVDDYVAPPMPPPAPLELAADPVSDMDAATKGYVDREIRRMLGDAGVRP